jgi:hypothetical protein
VHWHDGKLTFDRAEDVYEPRKVSLKLSAQGSKQRA